MRTYGRTYDELGVPSWVEVVTLPNGLNDYVYVTALIQELKLNLNESPFWGNRGIPAHPSVVQQVAPDYYTFLMQSRYAQFFLSLVIVRVPDQIVKGRFTPTYRINITTHYGVTIEEMVPV